MLKALSAMSCAADTVSLFFTASTESQPPAAAAHEQREQLLYSPKTQKTKGHSFYFPFSSSAPLSSEAAALLFHLGTDVSVSRSRSYSVSQNRSPWIRPASTKLCPILRLRLYSTPLFVVLCVSQWAAPVMHARTQTPNGSIKGETLRSMPARWWQ